MKIKLYGFLLSLMLLLLSVGIAPAATISLSQTGTGTYRISGTGMESVAGMSFIVSYDQTTLSDPQITAGQLVSGAMFFPNPTFTPSSIMLGIVSPQNFNSTGTIATIKFKVAPGTIPQKPEIKNPEFISSVASNVEAKIVEGTDTSGSANSPAPTSTSGSGDTSAPTSTSGSADTPAPTGTSGSGNTSVTTNTSGSTTIASTGQIGVLGTVTMPTDTPPAEQKEAKKIEASTTVYEETRASEPVSGHPEPQQADSGKEEKKEERTEKFVSHISMIERFRLYEGERTPAKLLAILKETEKGYSQDPPVMLPDGKATLKITISLPPDTTTAPNVAISKEGQMVSFKRSDEGTWVVEIRPKKDVGQVTLTYFINNQVTEIPLTVAPRLESFRGKPFAKLTETDFVQFIAGRTAAKEIQPYDLNGDKTLNHIDDFIFTANYLVQVPSVKTDKAPPAAKPSQEPLPGKPQDRAKPAAGSGKP